MGLAFSGLLTCGHREPIIRTADHLWTRGPRNLHQSPQLLNSRDHRLSNQGLRDHPLLCKHPFPGRLFPHGDKQKPLLLPSAGPRGVGADSLTQTDKNRGRMGEGPAPVRTPPGLGSGDQCEARDRRKCWSSGRALRTRHDFLLPGEAASASTARPRALWMKARRVCSVAWQALC